MVLYMRSMLPFQSVMFLTMLAMLLLFTIMFAIMPSKQEPNLLGLMGMMYGGAYVLTLMPFFINVVSLNVLPISQKEAYLGNSLCGIILGVLLVSVIVLVAYLAQKLMPEKEVGDIAIYIKNSLVFVVCVCGFALFLALMLVNVIVPTSNIKKKALFHFIVFLLTIAVIQIDGVQAFIRELIANNLTVTLLVGFALWFVSFFIFKRRLI